MTELKGSRRPRGQMREGRREMALSPLRSPLSRHLMAAFAGESQARNRYTCFALKAAAAGENW